MVYNGFIDIKKEDFEYAENCNEDIENGYEEDFLTLGSCEFDNGVICYVDLCSGNCNYYYQYELVDKDSNVVDGDTLDFIDTENGFEVEDCKDIYKIRFNIR